MKQTFVIPMIALLAICLVSFVSAEQIVDNAMTHGVTVSFNDIVLGDGMTVAGTVQETVPVRVSFTSSVDASDVRVKVWLEGNRNDVSAETGRFNVLTNSRYSKLLSLEMPSDIDNTDKEYILHVSISTSDGYEEYTYDLKLQRESYNFNIDSIDFNSEVRAGQTIPVSVVVENTGMEDLENGYVSVAIQELGVYVKGYFGDTVPVDNCDECDNTDSLQKTVYIKVPETAKAGVYDLVVKVYNKETVTTAKKLINVQKSESTKVFASVKAKDVKAGETVTFDLLVVNSGSNIKVYNIKTVSGSGISVSAPSVFTVGPESSKTVPITVTVPKDAEKGAYTFSVEVDGDEQIYSVNVTGAGASVSVIALTVILAIIFVVLLVVLIVLLAKKDKTAEETETSYY